MSFRISVALVVALVISLTTFSPADAQQKATCNGVEATIVGTKKSETIKGTKGDDVIVGLGGADKIDGRGGNDIICGGKGNDKIKGGSGDDVLYGDQGNDTLTGGNGSDVAYGGNGRDTLRGGKGDDGVLDGGKGRNAVDGGKGNDLQCVKGKNDRVKNCETPAQPKPDPKPEPEPKPDPEPKPKGNGQLGKDSYRYAEDGQIWQVTIEQVVPVETESYVDDDLGDCYAVLATATLLELPAGNVTSGGFANIDMELVNAAGRNVDSTTSCVWDPLINAGWTWSLYLEQTNGSTAGLFETFRSVEPPRFATVGRATDPEGIYDVVVTEQLGTPSVDAGTLPTADAKVGDETSVTFATGDNVWDVTLTEVRSIPLDYDTGRDRGNCYAVIGEATLTELGEGLVSESYYGPRADLVDDLGRSNESRTECNFEGLRSEGIVWVLDVEVVEGATVRFFDTYRTFGTPALATVGESYEPAGTFAVR